MTANHAFTADFFERAIKINRMPVNIYGVCYPITTKIIILPGNFF